MQSLFSCRLPGAEQEQPASPPQKSHPALGGAPPLGHPPASGRVCDGDFHWGLSLTPTLSWAWFENPIHPSTALQDRHFFSAFIEDLTSHFAEVEALRRAEEKVFFSVVLSREFLVFLTLLVGTLFSTIAMHAQLSKVLDASLNGFLLIDEHAIITVLFFFTFFSG